MAIEDLIKSVKRKVGAGVLGLGLVLSPVYAGCGEERTVEKHYYHDGEGGSSGGRSNGEWTCESGSQMLVDVCCEAKGGCSDDYRIEWKWNWLRACNERLNSNNIQDFFECVKDACKPENYDLESHRFPTLNECEQKYMN